MRRRASSTATGWRRAAPRVACLVATVACLLVALLGRSSFAQPGGLGSPGSRRFPQMPGTPPASPGGGGKIRVTTEDGGSGPAVLYPKKSALVGDLLVWNDGSGSLNVSRIAIRTDFDDPRVPPHFNVRFTDGSAGGTVIPPHSSKHVAVTWTPEHEPKVRQALGHVVFTSTDEAAGEVAMGFVGTLGGPLSLLTAHLLTWLLALPLLGALFALVMHVTGNADKVRVRGVVLAVTAIQALFGLVLYLTFNGAMTRTDGNDGFQLVERTVLSRGLGVEYYVGVDGTSVLLVLLLIVVGLATVVTSYGVDPPRPALYYGLLSLLLAGLMGVFVSLDLCVFAACWVVALGALAGLVAVAAPSALGGAPARRLVVYGTVSAVCLLFAVRELHLHSDPTFLADGTRVAHTFALPELMRVAYTAKHLTVFGLHWVKVVWAALFVAFAVLIPVVPFQRWFVGIVGETSEAVPVPVALLTSAVFVKAGLYGLLRVSVGVLPDGARWAAGTIVAFGLANLAVGAAGALSSKDLRRVIAYLTVADVGFCLLGVGSLTREGLAGCFVQMTSHGLVAALLVGVAGVLHDRFKTCDLPSLGGLGRSMPLFAVVAGASLLAAAGVPCLSAFWGEALAVLGVFPRQRLLAALAASGGLAVAAACVIAARRLFVDADSAVGAERAPPDLGPRELTAALPLLLLCVVLGLFPGALLTLVQGGIADLNQLVNPPGPDEIA